ncbi:MAG: hypothetical protein R3C56_35970 [Pirellulaceae bacterium]
MAGLDDAAEAVLVSSKSMVPCVAVGSVAVLLVVSRSKPAVDSGGTDYGGIANGRSRAGHVDGQGNDLSL